MMARTTGSGTATARSRRFRQRANVPITLTMTNSCDHGYPSPPFVLRKPVVNAPNSQVNRSQIQIAYVTLHGRGIRPPLQNQSRYSRSAAETVRNASITAIAQLTIQTAITIRVARVFSERRSNNAW